MLAVGPRAGTKKRWQGPGLENGRLGRASDTVMDDETSLIIVKAVRQLAV